MTNERKAFINKYIKEIVSTPNDRCALYSLLGDDCMNCQLGNSTHCFNPWYVSIFTLQTEEDCKDENYNRNIDEILTYISDTYPEVFV